MLRKGARLLRPATTMTPSLRRHSLFSPLTACPPTLHFRPQGTLAGKPKLHINNPDAPATSTPEPSPPSSPKSSLWKTSALVGVNILVQASLQVALNNYTKPEKNNETPPKSPLRAGL